ncbi:MAG TPA: YbhB/YbcL family Raf kinase inhibitor-like protein, partial [Bryobacteraceae bacterium]|nr:YbhB/YbcL family Raf kinase inhibitor-like protein [Bryobacteraceae bacterium]
LHLTVSGFPDGGAIPQRFTCDGDDVSPALHWSDAPEGTQSFALIVDDPDAPSGTWTHWILWDIPASVHSISEGDGGSVGISGKNDFGHPDYGGPCPPRAKGPHRYYFRLFALNVPSLKLKSGEKRAALEKALRPHVVARAEYHGRYGRA